MPAICYTPQTICQTGFDQSQQGEGYGPGQQLNDPSLSMDQFKSACRVRGVFNWFPKFAPVFQAVGRIFQEVDPWAYQVYRNNYDYWANTKDYKYMNNVMKVSGRCSFLSTAILVNQHVLPHKDSNDVPEGWVAMTVFGTFEGGFLCLPDLNIRARFQPGDGFFFRSAVLELYVTEFKGHRYSCVFFTHDAVLNRGALDGLRNHETVDDPQARTCRPTQLKVSPFQRGATQTPAYRLHPRPGAVRRPESSPQGLGAFLSRRGRHLSWRIGFRV